MNGEKTINSFFNSQINRLPGFSIICFIIQITTIISNQYTDTVIGNYFHLIFTFFLLLELFLCNHLFLYYISVVFKAAVFVIAYKYVNITVNGFLTFPLVQISFLYYHFSKYSITFKLASIIHIFSFIFLFLIYYITKQYATNIVIFYSIFIFFILNFFINCSNLLITDTRFTIHIKKRVKFIEYLHSIKFPVSALVLFLFTYLSFITDLLIKVIFAFFITLPSFIEIKNYITYYKNKLINKIEISWLFPIIYFILVGIICHIYNLDLSREQYNRVVNNTLNIIIPLAIVNISGLFILIQMNYNKFNSTYLIKQLIKSPPLLISIFIPIITLFFNTVLLNENMKYDFLPSIIFVLCIFSSVFLVIYSKNILETNIMLRKLMITVTDDDFDSYKENIVSMNETNIDAILKIVQAIIKNNDIPRAQSTFYSLSFWVNENIDKIKYSSQKVLFENTNKFNNFFSTINHELLTTNNIIIHNYYLHSIRDMIIAPLIQSNDYPKIYLDYKIIILSLHDYLIKRLEKKQDNYAIEIYNTIYFNCSYIFLKLEKCHKFRDQLDYDYFDFRKLFLDSNLDRIINTAIEYNCISFLNDIYIYRDLFVNYNIDNHYNYWDNKVKEIFVATRHIIQQKNKYLLKNNTYFFSINSDYEIFFKSEIFTNNVTEYQCYNNIIKYVIDELLVLFNYAISKNKRFNDLDFKLLWNECLYTIRKKDKSTFLLFYSFLTYILDKIFEKEYKKPIPDYGMITNLFDRILQIKKFSNAEFKDIIIEKYKKLKEKYPNLNELERNRPKLEFVENTDYIKRLEI
jgi:hypothetical protein